MNDKQKFVTQEEFSRLYSEILKLKTNITMAKGQENKLSIVAFDNSLDRLLAVFILATGAAASGMEANIFFTFWATFAMKRNKKLKIKKAFIEKMFSIFMPKGTKKLPLSKMNMGGFGPKIIRNLMKKKDVASLEELIEAANELGVNIFICEMSMDLMGIKPEEIIDYPNLKYAGVSTFLEEASKGKVTLFL